MSNPNTDHVLLVALLVASSVVAAPSRASGSDDCATAVPIAGPGGFSFDSTTATTGTDGQSSLGCSFYGQVGLGSDVWFLWTATTSGRVLLSTCGLTGVDTKIAIYDGPTCPGAGSATVACNDDITSSGIQNLQSFVEFDVVAGGQYLIQLGTYPLSVAGGNGSFSIEYVGGLWCAYDDGTTDFASEVGTNGVQRSTGWMYRMGQLGRRTRVTTISSAWGWTNTGTPLVPGLVGEVGIWEDPNDDGNPIDAVLLATASAPMVNPHTDLLQAISLPSAVLADGYFFVGAWVEHTNGFPIPRDISGCESRPGVGWLMGNEPGALNAANLAFNSTPPFQAPDGQTYVFLLRADCVETGPGVPFCSGDGVDPTVTTACPCGNTGATGRGCANSANANGALLDSSGWTDPDTTVLLGSGMPASVACIYLQGDGLDDTTFGDGVRCVGGVLLRLRTKVNVGGASSFPDSSDTITLSQRGGVTPGSGARRYYQTYYRNAAAAFCPPETFNATNGLTIDW